MNWLMFLVVSAFAQTMTVRPPSQCIVTPRSVSGSWTGTTTGSVVGFGGSCNGVSYNSATGENMLIVSLPQTAPVGGTLTLDTCNGTTWDTELIVSRALPAGMRCPSNSSMFTCLAASDDASACGNGMQSRVSIPASPGEAYAVIVTGFGSSSGPYTLNWNYVASAVSPSTAMSRSNTPSSQASPSSSFTPQPSLSSTPSVSIGPTWSSTASGIGSSSSAATPSMTISSSSSSTSDPSPSSSFTMRSSVSSTPSMAESSSMSDTHTGTPSSSQTKTATPSASTTKSPSFSMTAYPSRTPFPAAAAVPTKTEPDSISPGTITIGVVIGAFVTLGVFAIWNSYKNRSNHRRSVHLSPNIYFTSPPANEEVPIETKNTSFRTQPSHGKASFGPMSVRLD